MLTKGAMGCQQPPFFVCRKSTTSREPFKPSFLQLISDLDHAESERNEWKSSRFLLAIPTKRDLQCRILNEFGFPAEVKLVVSTLTQRHVPLRVPSTQIWSVRFLPALVAAARLAAGASQSASEPAIALAQL
jgi:hypothetical protein